VATTTPASTCRHEPLKYCASFDDLVACWDGGADFVGVSDSGIVPVLGRVLEAVKPRTLIVLRKVEDVVKSAEVYLGDGFDREAVRKYVTTSNDILVQFGDNPLTKHVAFDDLNEVETVEHCLRWLMPGNPYMFNRDLMRLNIEVIRERLVKDMALPHTHWYRS
jgi:hypothetical protein